MYGSQSNVGVRISVCECQATGKLLCPIIEESNLYRSSQ